MLQQIMAGASQSSPLTNLQSDLTYSQSQYDYYLNELISYYLYEDTLPSAPDSLIAVLSRENTISAKYKLVSFYLAQNRPADAQVLLNALPGMFGLQGNELLNYNNYKTLYNINIGLLQLGKTFMDIDSSQMQIVHQLAVDSVSRMGSIARAIVSAVEDLRYKERIFLPGIFDPANFTIRGTIYESDFCGGGSAINDTLVLISEMGDTVFTYQPIVTDYNGAFSFKRDEIFAIDTNLQYTIATKNGFGLENDEFKPVREWISGSPLSLKLSGVNKSWSDFYSNVDSLYNGGNAIDLQGNIYVAGYTGTTNNGSDYLVIKYSPTGQKLWTKTYNGAANGADQASDIVVDKENNCYVVGSSTGANAEYDIVTLKYSSSGRLIWEKRYSGAAGGADEGKAIAIDMNNNVYIAGHTFCSIGAYDIVILKYNKNGVLVWAKTSNLADNDFATDLKVDNSGNPVVSGYGVDYITLKYSPNGGLIWAKQFNSGANDQATSLAIDNSNNIFVTGHANDVATVKYNPNGVQQWVAHTPGNAYDITTDNIGNIYIAGVSNYDAFVLKYSNTGAAQWRKTYTSAYYNGVDAFRAITTDKNNDIYATGWSATAPNVVKYFEHLTAKFDGAGNMKWSELIHSDYHTQGRGTDLVVSDNLNVYVTGSIQTGGLYKMATVKYAQCPATADLKSTLLKPDVVANYNAIEDISEDEDVQVINFKENKVIVYPNPYTENTRIELQINKDASIALEVYTMGGQKLADIFTGNAKEGKYSYNFSAKKLGYSAGTYVLKITINNEVNSFWLVEMK